MDVEQKVINIISRPVPEGPSVGDSPCSFRFDMMPANTTTFADTVRRC